MIKDNDCKENSDFVLDTVKIGDHYFWLKLPTNFFDSEDIRVIEIQQNGERYIIYLLKLYLLAIRQEEIGILRYKEEIPYNDKILSTVTNTDIDVVRSAMRLFQQLRIIEIQDNGDILIESVIKMVGSESDSARRMRKLRAKRKVGLIEQKPSQCYVKKSREELEKNREEKIREDKNKIEENTPDIRQSYRSLNDENGNDFTKVEKINKQKNDLDEKDYVPSPQVQKVIDICNRKNNKKSNSTYKMRT